MSSVSADIRKRLPVSNPRARSKANTDKPSDSDSDGSVEEVVRHPTFYEQLASQHASSSGGMPNIQKIKIPLKQKLAKDELIQDFTVEEIDVDDHNQVEDEEGATIGDAGQAFFFAIPLLFVLILFDILIYIQYREDVDRGEVVLRAFKSFLRRLFQSKSLSSFSSYWVIQVYGILYMLTYFTQRYGLWSTQPILDDIGEQYSLDSSLLRCQQVVSWCTA